MNAGQRTAIILTLSLSAVACRTSDRSGGNAVVIENRVDLEALPSPQILAGSYESNYRDPAAVLLHSPSNGMGIKRSAELEVWRDSGELITLDQENWPWARARLTAGTILDVHDDPRVGKYLLFFHGTTSAEPHRHIGRCSLGIAWSDDLETWDWPHSADQDEQASTRPATQE